MGPFGSLPFGARPFDAAPTFTVAPDTTDTHDGDATEIRRRQRERDEAFRAERERLREQLRYAMDGPAAEDVAEELAEIALPQATDAQLRAPYELIDLDRLMQRLDLRMRIEQMAASRRAEDDDDDMLLLH